MQFGTGFVCCNKYRAKAGLSCDLDAQLECASIECARLAAHAPDRLHHFLTTLLPVFPPDVLLVQARQGGYIDTFIAAAACYCAVLRTLDERRAFFHFLAGYLSADQSARFKTLHESEWKRLRNKV
ncbi:hypothetical protein [Pandoraea sp. ISTKB]|uniref:hypothetical protein n=1 Tax=Pandoraea sp. ISTKB TaxID=1586708 RepID=UPI0008476CC6|nr:hypothetical protein [Pandoraea sp. ISTKB]ODP33087.1 hypothetical protein A9762_20810 [Pandoraea sp. ISTKB]